MADAATFKGYEVVQELGTGGFATVHLATSESSGEAYAIKQFTSELGHDTNIEKAGNERAGMRPRARRGIFSFLLFRPC